jgi:hypothetical protein
MIAPRLVSREEARVYLGVSKRHLIDAIDPELRRVYVGRRVLYDLRDLDAWIERRQEQARIVRRSRRTV